MQSASRHTPNDVGVLRLFNILGKCANSTDGHSKQCYTTLLSCLKQYSHFSSPAASRTFQTQTVIQSYEAERKGLPRAGGGEKADAI